MQLRLASGTPATRETRKTARSEASSEATTGAADVSQPSMNRMRTERAASLSDGRLFSMGPRNIHSLLCIWFEICMGHGKRLPEGSGKPPHSIIGKKLTPGQ